MGNGFKMKILITLSVFWFVSCTTWSSYFNKTEKIDLLLDKGISKYNSFFEEGKKLEEIKKVEPYFKKVIKLDSRNLKAEEYLETIKKDKERAINRYLNSIRVYISKKDPTFRDYYNAAYYLERIILVDRFNGKALSLRRKILFPRLKMESKLLKEGDELFDKHYYSKARLCYRKVQLINHNRIGLFFKISKVKKIYKKKYRKSVKVIELDTAKGKFKAALKKYNRTKAYLPQFFKSDNLKYEIYYNWALFLYNQKQYDSAYVKVIEALKIKRSKPGIKLRSGIDTELKKEFLVKKYPECLKKINEYIKKKKYFNAKNKINYVYKNVNNLRILNMMDKKLDFVESRLERQLESLYQKGVKLYNEDKFILAMSEFKKVLSIDPGYKETRFYYKKSKEAKEAMKKFD